MIRQGDIYWIEPEALRPETPGRRRPHVIVQTDVLNRSRIPTVVVCALSTNMKRVEEPGNVRLEAGEAAVAGEAGSAGGVEEADEAGRADRSGLPKASVVVVSQVSTVNKADLGELVGRLDTERVAQIMAGMRFQQRAFFR